MNDGKSDRKGVSHFPLPSRILISNPSRVHLQDIGKCVKVADHSEEVCGWWQCDAEASLGDHIALSTMAWTRF
jgi:hypothetical protein